MIRSAQAGGSAVDRSVGDVELEVVEDGRSHHLWLWGRDISLGVRTASVAQCDDPSVAGRPFVGAHAEHLPEHPG